MKFDDFDFQMRKYEEKDDAFIRPFHYAVLRVDGKGFTKLAADLKVQRPFDHAFARCFWAAAKAFMEDDTFRATYVYSQSDEISILLPKDSLPFGGKTRKFVSLGGALATAAFNKAVLQFLGPTEHTPLFDCRLVQLPTKRALEDYFNWRMEDCHRNALNTTLHWKLIQNGKSARQAGKLMCAISVEEKLGMLKALGFDYERDSEYWMRRGMSYHWETYDKAGYDPIMEETVMVKRRRIAGIDPLSNAFLSVV